VPPRRPVIAEAVMPLTRLTGWVLAYVVCTKVYVYCISDPINRLEQRRTGAPWRRPASRDRGEPPANGSRVPPGQDSAAGRDSNAREPGKQDDSS
jgi:hypothetical protein